MPILLTERVLEDALLTGSSGGSEDVMLDLMVRQLVKNYQRKTKAMERPQGSSKL